MSDARDSSSTTHLDHLDRLRFAEFERYRLFGAAPIPVPGGKTIAGWQIVQASSNRSQGDRLARLAAWIGRRAGRPIRILELGTNVGISGIYLLAGMAEAHGGHLATFEGNAAIADRAQARLDAFVERFDLSSTVSFEIVRGSFADTYEPFLRAMPAPLDLVFIDGHHQAEPTLRYHALVRDRLADGAVVIHDDIAWSPAMEGAWAEISTQEQAHLIVEQWQGGRPSRGIIYYGEPAAASRIRMHVDRQPGRMLRSWWRRLSRFSGG
jgi:predicted O-methyltransferase YrrM